MSKTQVFLAGLGTIFGILAASLCVDCHREHDTYKAVTELQAAGWTREQARIAHGFEGLRFAARTLTWAWHNGHIGVKK